MIDGKDPQWWNNLKKEQLKAAAKLQAERKRKKEDQDIEAKI